MVTIEH